MFFRIAAHKTRSTIIADAGIFLYELAKFRAREREEEAKQRCSTLDVELLIIGGKNSAPKVGTYIIVHHAHCTMFMFSLSQKQCRTTQDQGCLVSDIILNSTYR